MIQENQMTHDAKRGNTTAVHFESASSVGDTLESLLPADETGGNAVFRGQAVRLMRSIVGVLTDLHNHGKITFGANTLREWMSLEKLMSLSDKCERESGFPTQQKYIDLRRYIRRESMEALNDFLGGIPGFRFHKNPFEQNEDAHKQFGFARMYWLNIRDLEVLP